MPTYPLTSLLRIRRADEARAEQALALALAARQRAEAEQQRLAEAARLARGDLGARRAADVSPPARAAEAVGRERFWARRAAEVQAQTDAAAAHARDVLGPARARAAEAQALHLEARSARQVVDKLAERRDAAHRRQAERRGEAEVEDAAAAARPRPLRSPHLPR